MNQKKEWQLDRAALDAYVKSEGGGRWEIAVAASGIVRIDFINKHGSLFDCVSASEYYKRSPEVS